MGICAWMSTRAIWTFITIWDAMKQVTGARFMPTHYNRDLLKKLQVLKQDTKSVEKYYKEMKIPMIWANVKGSDEQNNDMFPQWTQPPNKANCRFPTPHMTYLSICTKEQRRRDKSKMMSNAPTTLQETSTTTIASSTVAPYTWATPITATSSSRW